MEIKKLTLTDRSYPEELRQISGPPRQLYIAGTHLKNILTKPRVAIVGSRNVSPYGRQVTNMLARQLAEQGVVIISGLAFGVDAAAHTATLEVNGFTIAVLPSPIERISPASNRQLAHRIVEQGGTLITEYSTETPVLKQNFVARNRLVAGLAQAVLITEAAEKSGSLHTARFALEQGKDVLAVPGAITSAMSVGANNLIKAGATPVTDYRDVLNILGLEEHRSKAKYIKGGTANEQLILDMLVRGEPDGAVLLAECGLAVSEFNQVMAMLEIGGKIRPLGANNWGIY